VSSAHEQDFPLALRNMGRILAAITGVTAGAAILLVGGLRALLSTCHDYDGESMVCGPLVQPLTLAAVLLGGAVAIAGGVGTAATGQARWIGAGMTVAIVLVMVLVVLLDMQQPAMN
jgi:hypothetical protein